MHFVIRSTMQKYTASFFASDFDDHFHQKSHILTTITTARINFELRGDEKLLFNCGGALVVNT